MKFKTTKSVLLQAVQTVEGAVPAKTTLPILANVLIEAQKDTALFHATDLDIGIVYTVDAEVVEDGQITIPAKRFADIIRELPEGGVTITVRKNYNMIIDCDSCSFRLIGLPKEDFPAIPKFQNAEHVVLSQPMVRNFLKKVCFAMSRDEARHVLNGTLFSLKNKNLRLVATDGRRLALTECKLAQDGEKKAVIVPAKTVNELLKVMKDSGEMKMSFSDNQVAFEMEATTIVSRLLEGEFPNYEQVIPKEREEKVEINKDKFLAALKRANLFTSTDSQSVKLDVFKNKIVISKVTPDIGEVKEEIGTKYSGMEFTVGFNPVYLADVLKNLHGESIFFEVVDAEKPAVFREDIAEYNGRYVYIVLPMQTA